MRFDVSVANAYKAKITYPTSFSVSPSLTDAVVWSGDPLEVTTMAEAVIINGRLQSMTSRQTLLRDRYLKTDGEWPPAYTHASSP